MRKNIIAVLVALCMLLVSIPVSASADNIPMDEEEITVGVMDGQTVNLLNQYFEQRQSYLCGENIQITAAFSGVTEDEAIHRSKLNNAGVHIISSQVEVQSISDYETVIEVAVLENVTYLQNNISATCSITHTLNVYDINGTWKVGADKYVDSLVGFTSCSYVTENEAAPAATQLGGAACMLYVARNEVGYQETGDNITKYGAYLGMNGLAWCISYIAWCANEAGIPSSVIPRVSGTWSMFDHFRSAGAFYYSAAHGGTVTPRAGDIFFLGDGTETGITHGGIVVSTSGNSIYVVEGNAGDCVRYSTISKTASDLMGFGRPAYPSTGHNYSGYGYDLYYHWYVCGVCGYTSATSLHNYVFDSKLNLYKCTACGSTTTVIPENWGKTGQNGG